MFGEVCNPERYLRLLRLPVVAPLLVHKWVLVLNCSAGLVLFMAPQLAMEPFGLTDGGAGLLMTYVSGIMLLSQGLLVPVCERVLLPGKGAAAALPSGEPLPPRLRPTRSIQFQHLWATPCLPHALWQDSCDAAPVSLVGPASFSR